MGAYNCGGTGMIRATSNRLGCYPLELTFTNIANPTDVVSKTMTNTVEVISNLTPGATYHVTYIDDEGYTTGNFGGLPVNQNITIPTVASMSIAQNTSIVQQNLNVLGFGRLFISVNPFKPDDVLSYTVITSDNPAVPVGYTGSVPLDSSGYAYLPRINPTDPVGYWPMGNYTITMSTPCGSRTINTVVKGYSASLSGNTLTSVCGGFNYVMNGTFDSTSAYQVIIVSGPSSVGQVRDLASTTASLPFNGLSYGTYVFGLRIKGGTQNVLTQTITYNANNAIIVDKTNTGGFVCAAGAVNGVLTITAQSNSPAPGNILEYALSTDGGVNYSSYQSGNTFTGLTNDTYFFRIKDGCGNVITQSVQIGVAAAPDATANGINSPATFCAADTGTIQLDINISGALSYLWTGSGINSSNEMLKAPVINYSDLVTGVNNFSCSVTLDAPCSSTTVSSLIININPKPIIIITNPAQTCSPNTIDITAPLITAGSDTDLTYTYFSDDAATIPVTDAAAITLGDTYYIKGTNTNGCTAIVPVVVTINDLPLAVISYLNAPYCQTGTATVDELGTAGGTYSSDANLSINSSTGEIDLEASTIGDHIITYLFSDGSCFNTFETTITINPLPVASISYPNTSYCNRGSATILQTGTSGGDYSSNSGLIINETTGEIDLGASIPGTYIVNYNFNDGTCSNNTTTSIIINETTLPTPIADLKAECSASPAAPTLSDLCAGVITGTTTTAFPISTQGTSVVTWTFNYGNNYTQSVNQNIIIDDVTPPVVPVLADLTAECSLTPPIPTTTDTCVGIITGTTTTVFPIETQGTTVIVWNFDDGNGNISTANQNIIIDDVTSPVVPVLADLTAECSLTPPIPTTTDTCVGIITGKTTTVFPIETQGTTVIVWSFDDGNGNISTANQNIIIDDVTAPVVPVLVDLIAQCSLTPPIPTATDICVGIITGRTTMVFPIETQGTTVIVWSFDDGNGNISTANQNIIIDDVTPPVVPILTDITGECIVNPMPPTATDVCAGIITGTTITTFPITAAGTTIITWSFNDGHGNISTANQNVVISQIALIGSEAAICSTSQAGYNITLSVTGQAPYTVIGNGAPGSWSGNNWTSELIASGNNYNITLQDANGCNSLELSGISPNCCSFNVVCPTFQNSTVSCYDELPSAVNLTEEEFEALGNGDGRIANTYCGVIEITASNGAYSGCDENVVRIYTITEYEDLNHNGIRDNGENTILNTADCTETILINDTIAPVFVETLPPASINVDCNNIPPEQNFTATDNCSTASVTYSETRIDGDCSSRYSLIRSWTASDDCNNQNKFTQTINVSCVEEVYNAISANGDGINDTFFIRGIDCFSNNTLKIYNRYGVIIYEKNGYDNVTNPFQGFSDGRGTIGKGNKLPTGTYFYTLEYDDVGRKIAKSGYLYVSTQ